MLHQAPEFFREYRNQAIAMHTILTAKPLLILFCSFGRRILNFYSPEGDEF